MKTRLGADCGTDHEPLIAKFRLRSKEVANTIVFYRRALKRKEQKQKPISNAPEWTVSTRDTVHHPKCPLNCN